MQLLGSNGLLTLSESSLGVGLRDACRRPPSAALCDLCLRHESRLFTTMQSQASHVCEVLAGSNIVKQASPKFWRKVWIMLARQTPVEGPPSGETHGHDRFVSPAEAALPEHSSEKSYKAD